MCRSMYGTRDAPQIWAGEVRRIFTGMGFQPCVSDPCVYHNTEMDVTVVTHVDDFLLLGSDRMLREVHRKIAAEFEVTMKMLGPEGGGERQIEFLGRHLRWTKAGIVLEANPKHVEELLKEWDMCGSRSVCSPGVAEGTPKPVDGAEESKDAETVLVGQRATMYRRAVATLNYISHDRVDIGFATKEVARAMANHTEQDEIRLKRVLRYLRGAPRAVLRAPVQTRAHGLAGRHVVVLSVLSGVALHGVRSGAERHERSARFRSARVRGGRPARPHGGG